MKENKKYNTISFNSIMECALQCKRFDVLENIFKELVNNKEVKPDKISYSTYIKGLCKNQKIEEAV